MKKHAIIPIFIPHEGCPNDCIFCNQKTITARTAPVRPSDVRAILNQYLATLEGRGLTTIEAAFFGGSFTGLSLAQQSAYLAVAAEYKARGRIDKIHLSTRPDYISCEILDNLKAFSVDIIELGVQSLDDQVLLQSGRGHNSRIVYESAALIKEYGFELGIQLMVGLPGDTVGKAINSARETVKIAPQLARLYPTIVLPGTGLYDLYLHGEYHPLSTLEAVSITKRMYKILADAGITILRVGLKSTDLISETGEAKGHTYHPAFRQLVEGEIAKDSLLEQLIQLFPGGAYLGHVAFKSNERCFSNLIGNKRRNRDYFLKACPGLTISYEIDSTLADMQYLVVKCLHS